MLRTGSGIDFVKPDFSSGGARPGQGRPAISDQGFGGGRGEALSGADSQAAPPEAEILIQARGRWPRTGPWALTAGTYEAPHWAGRLKDRAAGFFCLHKAAIAELQAAIRLTAPSRRIYPVSTKPVSRRQSS